MILRSVKKSDHMNNNDDDDDILVPDHINLKEEATSIKDIFADK